MRRILTIGGLMSLALLLATPVPTYAQNGPDGGGNGRQRRGQFGGGRGFRGGPNFDEMYDRIAKDLQFDEAQIAQLEEIKTAQRERMESFRKRIDAIREAEDSGDDATAQRLRDEFRQEREQDGGGPGFRGDPLSAIEPILTDAQREKLPTVRDQMRSEREQEMRQRFDERFEQISDRLQLTEDQQGTLEEIKAAQLKRMEDFRDRWGEVRKAYDSGDTALGDQLREQMMTEMRETGGPRGFMNETFDQLDPVLTDEQREIAADLRVDQRGGRGGRGRTAQNDEVQRERGEDVAQASPEDLPQTLKMDAQQQASYASMLAGHQRETAGLDAQISQAREKLAGAQSQGDTSSTERLASQLAQLEAQAAQADEAFYAQVGAILTPEQQAQLSELRADQQASNVLKDAPADLRVVIRAAMRLKLDRDQKEQLKTMVKGVKDDVRRARATDRKNKDRQRLAEKALGAEYRNRVSAILTPEQSQEFTTLMDKMSPKGRNRNRNRI